MKKIACLLSIVFLLFLTTAYAQDEPLVTTEGLVGMVYGVITNASTGRGIKGVTVSSNMGSTTLTDSTGNYQLSCAEASGVVITYSKSYYTTKSHTFTINQRDMIEYNTSLSYYGSLPTITSPVSGEWFELGYPVSITWVNFPPLNTRQVRLELWGQVGCSTDKYIGTIRIEGSNTGAYNWNAQAEYTNVYIKFYFEDVIVSSGRFSVTY